MKITKENIIDEARQSNLEVLKSDLVDKFQDKYNWTPLHYFAWYGIKEVLSHPSIDKVKDDLGETPLHLLVHCGYLNREDLKKRFPWYKKEIRNIEKAVDEIVNTPDSVRFILEDS